MESIHIPADALWIISTSSNNFVHRVQKQF